MGSLQDARAVWRTLVIIITPIVFIPLLLPASSQESKCGYVLAVMAVYWVTEALPIAVTALLPLVMLPLLGIMPFSDVSKSYFTDMVFRMLGMLTVALAVEESNLHKRFALRMLLQMGVQPRKLLLGIMVSTAFLSMWINNTATTVMMTPIARALLTRLFSAQRRDKRENRLLCRTSETESSSPQSTYGDLHIIIIDKGLGLDTSRETLSGSSDTEGTNQARETEFGHTEIDGIHRKKTNVENSSDRTRLDHLLSEDGGIQTAAAADDDDDNDDDDNGDDDKSNVEETETSLENLDEASAKLVKALCLSVCYSANIGGISTQTGTGPNLIFYEYVESLSKGAQQVSFVDWMVFGLPVAAVCLMFTWLWLQLTFFGVKKTLLCQRQTSPEEDKALEHYLRREQRKMGNMSFAEKVVLGHFLVLVALWLTRSPGVFPGWAVFFPKKFVSDTAPTMLVIISLFVFPREKPAYFCCHDNKDTKCASSPSVLQWFLVNRKLSWGVMLLLGGGFTLAKATEVSGLSRLIAQQLMLIGSLPAWVASLVVVIVTSFSTEILSNVVIASLILPILTDVAVSMNLHPVYFLLPAAVASSFAFMLPVATAPNAIVFGYNDIKVMDMVKTGFVLNLICILVLTIAINTLGDAYFGLDHIPDWAYGLTQTTPLPTLNATTSN